MGKYIETDSGLVATTGWEQRDGLEVMAKAYGVPSWGNDSILKVTVLMNVKFCD